MSASDTNVGMIPKSKRNFRLSVPAWIVHNPVILKEMRSRMRGWRSLLGITGFIVLLSIVVTLVYFSIVSVGNSVQIDVQRSLGRTIFFTIYGIELMVICMTSPAMTAGAISQEKEQQTYDLLRTTMLTARDLVLGKLVAAISFILLFMVAAIPLQSIAFVFGGLTIGEVLVSVLIMILSALMFGTVGIFFSSFIAKTRISTGASQIASLCIVIIIPVTIWVAILALETQLNFGQMTDLEQILFFGVLGLIGASSPVLTAVLTEVVLTEKQTLFYFAETLNSGTIVYIPSPWLVFLIISLALSIFLLYFAIRFVKRAET